jgi:hypothetical protein
VRSLHVALLVDEMPVEGWRRRVQAALEASGAAVSNLVAPGRPAPAGRGDLIARRLAAAIDGPPGPPSAPRPIPAGSTVDAVIDLRRGEPTEQADRVQPADARLPVGSGPPPRSLR